ncbi:hypothetical protein [Spirosoma areae]
MTPHTDDLKQQIERILHWEQSSHWRLRDFAHLSKLIFKRTHQQVDERDLQAFWQSSVVPCRSFLDALAHFADYVDWADFCARNFYGEVEADHETQGLHAPMWEIPMRWVILICWFSVVASIVIAVLLLWKR